MALANFMRLSLEKAAHVAVGWARSVGDPGFARDEQTAWAGFASSLVGPLFGGVGAQQIPRRPRISCRA
jgi:hypothetical protein